MTDRGTEDGPLRSLPGVEVGQDTADGIGSHGTARGHA
jgi:hypothetical protein